VNLTFTKMCFAIGAGIPLLGSCSSSCISKEKASINDPSGLTFVITETNCDSFGNDTAVTIDAGAGDSGKTTLFKFDPDERSGTARISVEGGKTIVVEIDSVAEILRQESRYKAYDVRYKIGEVVYPHK
jgi:hypothetical protein